MISLIRGMLYFLKIEQEKDKQDQLKHKLLKGAKCYTVHVLIFIKIIMAQPIFHIK